MSYTHMNLDDVPDLAPQYGFDSIQEARFCNEAFGTEQTGLSLHRLKPGARQGFGHHHREAEEVYLALSGSGRANLDGELVELRPLDALRVPAPTMRAFEAGPDGLVLLAFGPRRDDDRGEIIAGWWEE